MNSKDLRELCEAYSEIYEDEFESWVNSLLDEGYDLSDYTWDEMHDAYIEEQGGQRGSGSSGVIKPITNQPYESKFRRPRNANMARSFSTTSGVRALKMPSLPTNLKSTERAGITPGLRVLGRVGGGNAAASVQPTTTPSLPAARPPASRPPAAGGSTALIRPTTKVSSPSPQAGQTGDKAKDMQTWAKANPTLANKPQRTFNPLMQKTFGYQTGFSPREVKGNTQKMATLGSVGALSNTKKTMENANYRWGSASKLVDDIADAYHSVYEAKKVDQDKDGDNDYEDVQIARMIASGVPKEEAIRRVRGKSYNEEYELSEVKGFGGRIPKDSTDYASSDNNSSSASERGRLARREFRGGGTLNQTYAKTGVRSRTSNYDKQEQPNTQMRDAFGPKDSGKPSGLSMSPAKRAELAAKRAERQGEGKRANKIRSIMQNVKEELSFQEEVKNWVNSLIEEGYDLSDYTWDEMLEIYEETDEEKRRNERRARIAELQASGRVMTSSKRTSARAKERREEQKAERLERLANQALKATRGATRRSSKPMGSTPPEPKPAAPSGEEARRLPTGEKVDPLHKLVKQVQRGSSGKKPSLDDLLSQIKNEDFVLWIDELLDEGYDLSDYTFYEMVEIYENTTEKLAKTAGKKSRKSSGLSPEKREIYARLASHAKRRTTPVTRRTGRPFLNQEIRDQQRNLAVELNRFRDRPGTHTPGPGSITKNPKKLRKQKAIGELPEDFVLWIDELLDEGYELENWTDEELYELYEEILEEKYSR